MLILEFSALAVFGIITLVRLPSAIVNPQSRLSWAATFVGTLAFTARAFPSLDRFLGGTNYISLVQNACAVTAFWLLTQAALAQNGRRPRRWWLLPLLLIAFTVPFVFTDRGSTSDSFIVDHIAQTGTWLYASIYMAVFGSIALSLVAGLRRRQPRSYRFFLVGCILVIVACIDEIISLALDHFQYPDLLLRDVFRNVFDVLFYPGAILVILGVASFTFTRFARDRRLLRHKRELQAICARREITPRRISVMHNRRELILDVYNHLIAIRDYENVTEKIGEPEAAKIASAENIVMQYLTSANNDPTPRSIPWPRQRKRAS